MIGKTGQQTDVHLRPNLRQLEVFVATARAGSTRGAADRMARSQSAASAALAWKPRSKHRCSTASAAAWCSTRTVARCCPAPWVIVAAPTHPLAANGKRSTPRQLAAAAWILRESVSGTRQAADTWLLEHLGPLEVEYELGSTEAIKRLAAAGAGLACLSRHAVADDLARGSLVELRTRLPRAPRRLAIAVRRDKRLGRAAENFVRHCTA